MGYSYDEFLKRKEASGLAFSDADMKLAQRDPDAGMSILTAKQQYTNAKDDAGRSTANRSANQIRAQYGGYTAGKDGAGFTKDSTYFTYEDPYADRMNAALDKLLGVGNFENPYQGQIDEALRKITSRDPFSYDAETDPVYQQYRKTYLREGQRANEDTLGNYAAMTGGMPSTAAVNAASQAQDYYNAQLGDKIPELYALAYQMYADEGDRLMDQLSAVRGLGQDALSEWGANLQLAQQQLAAAGDASDRGYNRAYNKWGADYQIGRDAVSDYQWQSEMNLQKQAKAEELLYQLAQTGQRPSHNLIVQAGLNDTDVNALSDWYKQQQLLALAQTASGGSASGSSGKRSASSTSSKSQTRGADYTGLFRAAKNSGYPESFIANNYKKYGFTSKTGLSAEYKSWDAQYGKVGYDDAAQSHFGASDTVELLKRDISNYRGDKKTAALNKIEQYYKAGQISEREAQQLLKYYGLA